MTENFKLVKQFDPFLYMPDSLQKKLTERLIDRYDSFPRSCCEFNVYDECKDREDWEGKEILWENEEEDMIVERGDDEVSDWFFDNGAKAFETVIIEC